MNLTDTTQHGILNNLYLEAANELLATHDIHCHVTEPDSARDPNKSRYVSVLGATGEGIALSSMLRIRKDLLLGLHPAGSSDVSDKDLEDWCRELNNQLVGRMKNKLLRYGITITLGLPVLLTGTNVTVVAAPDATVSQHAIQIADGAISLTLETLVDPALQIQEQDSVEDGTLLEGAVALF